MRLTNQMREEFLRKVLADVPYTNMDSQIEAVVLEDSIRSLPAGVQSIARDSALKHYLHHESFHIWRQRPSGLPDQVFAALPRRRDVSVSVPCYRGGSSSSVTAVTREKVKLLEAEDAASYKRLADLGVKLWGSIQGITTLDALRKALPEFEKYMPAEISRDRTLPVLANVVSDFVKAGWPKGGKRTPTQVAGSSQSPKKAKA